MYIKKPLLTEADIGRTVYWYSKIDKHVYPTLIVDKTFSNKFVLKDEPTSDLYLCDEDGIIDTENFVLPMKKIDLWDWYNEDRTKHAITMQVGLPTGTIVLKELETEWRNVAVIPVERLQEEEPYFYEGEGLNE